MAPSSSTAILHPSPCSHSAASCQPTIIDIPFSIALAQHLSPPTTPRPSKQPASTSQPTSTHPTSGPTPPPPANHLTPPAAARTLLSSPAPTKPYPSTEPKSEKARQSVLERQGGEAEGGADEAWIAQELGRLLGSYGGEWCLERRVREGKAREGTERMRGRGKKRRRVSAHDTAPESEGGRALVEDDAAKNDPQDTRSGEGLEDSACEELDLRSNIEAVPERLEFSFPWYLPPPRRAGFPNSIRQISNLPWYNSHAEACFINFVTSQGHEGHPYRYLISPGSTFLLSNISQQTTAMFSSAARARYKTPTTSAGPGQFDFVLLDPPWANRSVRRSRKYSTADSQPDPVAALKGMLGQHIAPKGLVGCWITNKHAVRAAALSAFEQWGVELVEEWIWLKVTTKGEPVTELGGIWRKPYEVLLLGRKGEEGKDRGYGEVKKKLIAAVPDLHSRKPNLKELIEPMMPDPTEYRALEIFARNLTAGWWAWGDECLKFNWDGYWSSPD